MTALSMPAPAPPFIQRQTEQCAGNRWAAAVTLIRNRAPIPGALDPRGSMDPAQTADDLAIRLVAAFKCSRLSSPDHARGERQRLTPDRVPAAGCPHPTISVPAPTPAFTRQRTLRAAATRHRRCMSVFLGICPVASGTPDAAVAAPHSSLIITALPPAQRTQLTTALTRSAGECPL